MNYLLNRYRIPIASAITGANLSLGVSAAMDGRIFASTILFGLAAFLVVLAVSLELLDACAKILNAMCDTEDVVS